MTSNTTLILQGLQRQADQQKLNGNMPCDPYDWRAIKTRVKAEDDLAHTLGRQALRTNH